MTPQLLQQQQQSAINQGNQLQSQFNAQVPGLQSNYGQAQNQATAYGQQYSDFLKNLPMSYTNDMSQIGNMMGYNAGTTQKAAQGLTSAENIMNALPQAVNQMGNYSGATAGQVAQNYGNMAGNINQQVTQANNALQNQLGMFGQMQTGAQNITGQQTQGYGQLYSTAVQQMQTAGSVMSQIEGLQQQQGQLTAQQVAAYNQAYQSYETASQTAQQIAMANAVQQKYGVGGIANAMGVPSSVTNPTPTANKSTASAKTAPKKPSQPSMPSSKVYSTGNIAGSFTNPFGSLKNAGTDVGLIPLLGANLLSKL